MIYLGINIENRNGIGHLCLHKSNDVSNKALLLDCAEWKCVVKLAVVNRELHDL